MPTSRSRSAARKATEQTAIPHGPSEGKGKSAASKATKRTDAPKASASRTAGNRPGAAAALPLSPWDTWKASPDESMDRLCAWVEDGRMLSEIARDLGVQPSTLTRWLDADPQRSARARDSRARAAQAYDEQALEEIRGAGDPFELARAKESAHHLRWRASKVNPRDYGDRLDVTQEVTLRDVPDDELRARAAALLAGLAGAATGEGDAGG